MRRSIGIAIMAIACGNEGYLKSGTDSAVPVVPTVEPDQRDPLIRDN